VSEIAFHFNVADREAHACRLLRKVCALGHRVVVVGPREELARLDVALWTFAPLEFLTHCWAQSPTLVREASSVVLASDTVDGSGRDVLLNLGGDIPAGFENYPKVVEIVPSDDDGRSQARERWRHYTRTGHTLVRHDMAGR
jgi:DNA polymerase-3 subunit chi